MFDTKALISSLASSIARTKTVKEAYTVLMKAGNVEGINIPTYEEELAEIEELRKEA